MRGPVTRVARIATLLDVAQAMIYITLATSGGHGDDILVGDMYYLDFQALDRYDGHIEGEPDDTIRAFRDSLNGGDGDDVLYGDFFDGSRDFQPSYWIEGNFSGRDKLFSDVIAGGIGADVMSGGAGADRFGVVFARPSRHAAQDR